MLDVMVTVTKEINGARKGLGGHFLSGDWSQEHPREWHLQEDRKSRGSAPSFILGSCGFCYLQRVNSWDCLELTLVGSHTLLHL